jgi:hypothetical protein
MTKRSHRDIATAAIQLAAVAAVYILVNVAVALIVADWLRL